MTLRWLHLRVLTMFSLSDVQRKSLGDLKKQALRNYHRSGDSTYVGYDPWLPSDGSKVYSHVMKGKDSVYQNLPKSSNTRNLSIWSNIVCWQLYTFVCC
jgi:hypothetical protein